MYEVQSEPLSEDELREYHLLEARMDELETLRLKTIERYFWASISVGGALGYLFGSNLADNDPELFSQAWLMPLIMRLEFSIFGCLIGYLLGQFIGFIRFRRSRRRYFSIVELDRVQELRFRYYRFELSEPPEIARSMSSRRKKSNRR